MKNKFEAYSNNIRPTWKLTNSILGKSKMNPYDLSINHDDTLITDNLQLANLFNNYFSQIGSGLRQKIPTCVKDPLSILMILMKMIAFSVYMK